MSTTSGFDTVTKYLDRSPASVDTTQVTKPYDRRAGRAIKKINTVFTIPAYYVLLENDYPPEIWPSRIVKQYNFTMPQGFRITNWKHIATNAQFTFARVAVRWREDEVGYRYALTPFRNQFVTGGHIFGNPDDSNPLPNVADYTGQRVGAQFCIEIWSYRYFGLVGGEPYNIGLLEDIEVITGLIRNPVTAEELEDRNVYLNAVTDIEGELAEALPEDLPVDYNANGAWNSN